MKEYKVIPSGSIARTLLKQGFEIADVKAARNNKEKTIFVFKNSEALERALSEIEENNRQAKGDSNGDGKEAENENQKN